MNTVFPFVKIGGTFLSYKSAEIKDEADSAKKAIKILGGKVETIEKFELPNSKDPRSFVKIKKIEKTPKKFPRKAGTPSKEPIC